MVIRNKYMKLAYFILISASMLLSTVYGNGAKPIQDPSGNGGLVFDENPGVALLNEKVTFNLTDSRYISQAIVTVEYEMKNLLEQDQQFDMFFVIPPAGGYPSNALCSVSLNSEDITEQTYFKSMKRPDNWKASFPQGLVEPYSKKAYDDDLEDDALMPSRYNGNQLSGIHIPIFIKAGSTSKLLIQYNCEGGFNRRPEFHNTIYSYLYYLTPAKFWNQDPKVTLSVTLPKEQHYAFHSSIPMNEISQNAYSVTLESLPDSEWVFSFVDRKGLIYGTNSSQIHSFITGCIATAIFIISFILYKRYKAKVYIKCGYILAVAFFYLFKGKIIDGYMGEFIIMIPVTFILLLIIPIMYHVHSKQKTADK